MTSSFAFFVRLLGLLAASVATLSVAVGMLGQPAVQDDARPAAAGAAPAAPPVHAAL